MFDLFNQPPDLPVTPYAGTSGWSGSDTSESRARTADQDGTTKQRQTDALEAIRKTGAYGMTWRELAMELNVHHGSASGVLSVLHKDGRLARLTSTRTRCKVYVLPEFTRGRAIEQPKTNRIHNCPNCGVALTGSTQEK